MEEALLALQIRNGLSGNNSCLLGFLVRKTFLCDTDPPTTAVTQMENHTKGGDTLIHYREVQ